ncbi:hypothetical protein LR48_Vigan03g050200 [Vigna angularis]|uniref:Uncharacterized protein n=1 Tax=Phaseolus angularis TaxID=3914 RepID=A0A0L9U2X5_PHAAN|nr:hypothetical protein LR48_Vigan03g050200 [Vigna angularis]
MVGTWWSPTSCIIRKHYLEVHLTGSLGKKERGAYFWYRESFQKKETLPPFRFQPFQEHPWEAALTSEGLRGGSGWASGEMGVLAARSGRGSEELLRLQGDLELHVWEEIDPKIYKEVFKRISAERAYVQFCESKMDVRSNGARPNSGRPISERSVIVLSVRPNQPM